MEVARRWLEAQRATPSFAQADGAGNAPADHVADTGDLLHGRLPADLDHYDAGLTKGPVRATSVPARGDVGLYAAPIHEQLLAKGKLYAQRQEALRERAIMEEKKKMRATPKVTEDASRISRAERIEDRFERVQAIKDMRMQRTAQVKEEEEERRLRGLFKPKISDRARHVAPRVGASKEQLEALMRRREERAGQLRLHWLVQEMQDVQDGPSINPVSEKLAARKREREGLGGLSHIEAMVERDRRRQHAAWEEEQMRAEDHADANPRITLYAAALQRTGDVGQRLYEQGTRTRSRTTDAPTPRGPRITAVAEQAPRSGRPIEDELMQRHLQSLAAREETVRLELQRERERHAPAINAVSDTIASRLPQTAMERLTAPRSRAPQQEPAAPRGHVDPLATQERDAQRAQQLAAEQTRRDEKLRALREEADAREMTECTFQPAILERGNATTESLFERAMRWRQRRDAQVAAQRTSGVTEGYETQSRQPSAVSPGSHHMAHEVAPPAGADDFVRRQAEARRLRQEKLERLYLTGSSWNNAPTTPRPPNLGQPAPVKALGPPVAPTSAIFTNDVTF
jgi:hypothetical protein